MRQGYVVQRIEGWHAQRDMAAFITESLSSLETFPWNAAPGLVKISIGRHVAAREAIT